MDTLEYFGYKEQIFVQQPSLEFTRDTNETLPYNSLTPLVRCDYLSSEFYECELLDNIPINDSRACKSKKDSNDRKYGGQRYADVQKTSVYCTIFDGIECWGNRTFLVPDIPCIKYSNHYFASTLLYSIFLGMFAVDRYCLGHIGIGVAKMITIGGVGLWWIVDVALLISGRLMPADESNWVIYH
ncbi:unnamed protein product [Didymodactylos carnosus]|uniref:TM2 domain-containing protein n=1 Tax=Didymodactylos carnosus TaxID=1234261 RepID=A0A814NRJ0_9BILA|nr:unnamed protein product [Didymodactylos carnosus]CAF3862601.1 unnamed protein product [Didymodactylos carnosus]